MKKRRVHIYISLVISLLAVFVASIGTFAWFQISVQANTGITTGSDASGIGLSISDVVGYKYSYFQEDAATVDYNRGAPISHTFKGESTTLNRDQESTSPLDAPGEGFGAGYFMIPADNSTGSASYRYTNEGVVQLTAVSNSESGGNRAGMTIARYHTCAGNSGYQFEANTYQIKQYSFKSVDGATTTVNDQVQLSNLYIDGAAGSGSTAQIDGNGNLKVINLLGYYNVWLTKNGDNWNLELETAFNPTAKNRSKAPAPRPTRTSIPVPESSHRVFIKVSISWMFEDGCHMVIYNGDHSNVRIDNSNYFTSAYGDKIYYFDTTVEDTCYIKRCYSNNYAGYVNQWSPVQKSPENGNNFFELTGDGSFNAFKGYVVEVNNNGSVTYDVAVADGSNQWGSNYDPAAPVRDGYKFIEWCTDSEMETPYVPTKPTEDFSIYAHWYNNRTYYLYDSHIPADGVSPILSSTLYAWFFKPDVTGAWSSSIDYCSFTGPVNGLWTISISEYYDSTYTHVLFSDKGNFESNNQTVDIELDPDKPYISLLPPPEPKPSPFYYQVTQASTPFCKEASTTTNTYYFIDRQSWGSVSVHMWTDGFYYTNVGTLQDWPGTSMSPVNGVYSIEASEDLENIILNNGSSSKQTVDIETSGHDGEYYVINNYSDGKYSGEWMELKALTFELRYFDEKGNSLTGVEAIVGNESGIEPQAKAPHSTITLKDGESYEFKPDNKAWFDEGNAILYYFPSSLFGGWYATEACTGDELTEADVGDTGVVVYGKMVCDTSNIKTIYVDNKKTEGLSWSGVGFHSYNLGVFDYFDGSEWKNDWNAVSVPSTCIGANLYRVSLPSIAVFNAVKIDESGYYVYGGTNQTANINSLSSQADGSILRITTDSPNPTYLSMDWVNNVGAGVTATIIKNGGEGGNEFDMGAGDGTYNRYVYPSGLVFEKGDYFVIELDDGNTTTTMNFNDLDGSYSAYLRRGNSNIIEFTQSGSFTFYITTAGRIALASVPSKGNGYYICPDSNLYINSAKMESIDSEGVTNKARYIGYSTKETASLYIRSYLDGVDNLVKGFGNVPAGVTCNGGTGEFTLPAGDYNIYVYDDGGTLKISIAVFNSDDFLLLNPADYSKTDTSSHIEAQNTSLVLEAKCTTTGNKPASIYVDVSIDVPPSGIALSNYVCVAAYVSAIPLAEPYSGTRTNAYGDLVPLTNSNPDASQTVTLEPSSGVNRVAGTYYVYILIDYKPGVDLSALGGIKLEQNVTFRIGAKQYVA